MNWWTSIYQLFWGSLGTRVLTHPHMFMAVWHGQFPTIGNRSHAQPGISCGSRLACDLGGRVCFTTDRFSRFLRFRSPPPGGPQALSGATPSWGAQTKLLRYVEIPHVTIFSWKKSKDWKSIWGITRKEMCLCKYWETGRGKPNIEV